MKDTAAPNSTSRFERIVEFTFHKITWSASTLVVVICSTILFSLWWESRLAIGEFGLWTFLKTADWDPVRENFGALTTLYGTAVTTVLALVIAIPLSLGIAIFITELCPGFLKGILSTAIELLAAIPSIIYGMWGLFTFSPIMAKYVEPFLQATVGQIPLIGKLFSGTPMGIDILTASIVLSIMITPFISSIARDTFELTPKILKESAYGIGTTRWEVVKDVVLPHSRVGVFGGIVIAMGRALGETMAVAFVLGNRHEIARSLFDASATITVTLANEFTEADSDLYLSSLFLLALMLFFMSFTSLALAKYLLHRRSQP